MKNLIIGILAGMVLSGAVAFAWNPSDLSLEQLWNKVFDSTNNKIAIIGV